MPYKLTSNLTKVKFFCASSVQVTFGITSSQDQSPTCGTETGGASAGTVFTLAVSALRKKGGMGKWVFTLAVSALRKKGGMGKWVFTLAVSALGKIGGMGKWVFTLAVSGKDRWHGKVGVHISGVRER